MKKLIKQTSISITLIALFAALALLFTAAGLAFTHARYVTEIGGVGTFGEQNNDLPFEVQTPISVKSQKDLVNAIESGYGYVEIGGSGDDTISGSIIMTGDTLDLKRDLTIDLKGNEIQRNNAASLLSITPGTTLTIIDTVGGGGLYNPIGTVLNVMGGDVKAYGGRFESGPRPVEYYSKLYYTTETGDATAGKTQIALKTQNVVVNGQTQSVSVPQFPIRSATNGAGKPTKYGNVYLDKQVGILPADTYCYMIISGTTDDDVTSLDVSGADFSYTYKSDYDGNTYDVMICAYANDVALSAPASGTAPHYAAVNMSSGTLDVNVTVDGNNATEDGSFHSYFGTEETACVYMTGGVMNVSTNGVFSTVDPKDLPEGVPAKQSLGSCIICAGTVMPDSGKAVSGGTLNITKLVSATAYNGSVISMSGGELTLGESHIYKNATLSRTNSYKFKDDLRSSEESISTYPVGEPFTDAAIFVNGGTVNITKSSTVKVTKSGALLESNNVTDMEKEDGSTDICRTTFGMLVRGTPALKSEVNAADLNFELDGAYSYGLFATRGSVTMHGGRFKVNSENNSYGIYAVNKSDLYPVTLDLRGTHIDVGRASGMDGEPEFQTYNDLSDLSNNKISGITDITDSEKTYKAKNAAIGVYLNSNVTAGGSIYISDVSLKSSAMTNAYTPVKWTLTQEGETDALVDAKTLADCITALEGKSSAVVAPGATLAVKYTLSWAWAFETGENPTDKAQNNIYDTYLGYAAQGTDLPDDMTWSSTDNQLTVGPTGSQTVYDISTAISFELDISVEQSETGATA